MKRDGVKPDSRPDRDAVAADAALLARIATLSPPAMPAALRERIVRNVPRLAQLPAPAQDAWPARAQPAVLHVMVRPDAPAAPRRPRSVVAGLASLAAGIAAIALIGPQSAPPGPVAPAHRAAVMALATAVTPRPVAIARARVPATAHHRVPSAAIPGPGGTRVGPDDSAQSHGTEMTGTEMASAAAPPLSGDIALAPAVPARRPVYGPVDTEPPSAAFAAYGANASAQSSGYGFVGRDSGAARGPASARSLGSP